jgi:hypothetical protein
MLNGIIINNICYHLTNSDIAKFHRIIHFNPNLQIWTEREIIDDKPIDDKDFLHLLSVFPAKFPLESREKLIEAIIAESIHYVYIYPIQKELKIRIFPPKFPLKSRGKLIETLIDECIHYVHLHPIQTELMIRNGEISWGYILARYEENTKKIEEEIYRKLWLYISNIKWNSVILPKKKLRIFIDNTRDNKFMWETEHKNGITLEGLTKAVHMVKSSINDFGCQLFLRKLTFIENDDGYIFKVDFYHAT